MPTTIDLLNLGSSGIAISGPADFAHIGVSVSSAGDFNGDGIEDFIFASNAGDLVLAGRGAAYLIYGKVGGPGPIDLSALTLSQGFAILGPAGDDGADMNAAPAGDVNGDGYADIVIGAPRNSLGGHWDGAAWVLYGHTGTSATIDLGSLSVQQGLTLRATAGLAGFAGCSVTGIGDINHDGYADIAIGSSDLGVLATFGGRAYILFGSAAGFANGNLSTLTAQQGFTLDGTQANGFGGDKVAGLGDINGDGIDDFAVSAPLQNSQTGNIYVYFGKSSGWTSSTLGGFAANDGFAIHGTNDTGWSLSRAGDVNGDGYADILFTEGESTLAPVLLFGKASGFGTIDIATLTASQGFRIGLGTANGSFFASVAGAGDVNGDGFADIAVGTVNFGAAGAAYVLYGGAGLSSLTFGVSDGLILQTGTADDQLGQSVGFADVNGDGFSEVLVGAASGTPIIADRGAVYVVNGIVPAGSVTRIGSAASQTIRGGPGDDTLSGLGGNDALYGNAGNDQLDGGSGIDRLFGGAGNDRLTVSSAGSGSMIDGGADTDTLAVSGAVSLGGLVGIEAIELAGGAVLTLTGSQFASGLKSTTALSGSGTIAVNMNPGVFLQGTSMAVQAGSSIAMTVNGTSGTDIIKASRTASNTINGGDGADQIRGGNLADTINGGNGDDKIIALGGADTLTGGAGIDQFRFYFAADSGLGAASDHITDFTPGTDKLDFRLLDADPGTPGRQVLTFIGTQGFHATPGTAEVHYTVSGANLLLEVDLNGDGNADMQIVLDGIGAQSLSAGDFLL